MMKWRRNKLALVALLLSQFSPFATPPASAIGSGNCVSTVTGATATATQSGSTCIVIFTSGSGFWTLPQSTLNVTYLVVGGGGAASRGTCSVTYGPGGGGGGVQSGSITLSGTVSVSVGAGGANIGSGCPTSSGASGSQSTLSTITAAGGAGSGRGKTGGTSGNGFAGGTDTVYTTCGECGAGGGGGATAAGNELNGGAGFVSSITGTSKTYGSGGAGRGGTVFGTATSGGGVAPSACAGVANTGGGGADCGGTTGGGGSGIVVAVYTLNSAPTIGSFAGASTASYSTNENVTSLFSLDATDSDANTTLTYSLSGIDSADFLINSSGVLAFSLAPDFEAPVDSDQNNSYTIICWVSDGSLSDSQTVTITVLDVVEDSTISTPLLSGTPTKGQTISVSVNLNVAGKVQFLIDGKRIAGCIARPTTGSYPNYSSTCVFKPVRTGRQYLRARLTPTNSNFIATQSTSVLMWVYSRTSTR